MVPFFPGPSFARPPHAILPVRGQVWGAYLNFEATDLLDFNFRGEKFQAGSGLGSGMSDGWGITTGANYKLWDNTKARFEYRYDQTDTAVNGKTGNKSLIWNLIYSF